MFCRAGRVHMKGCGRGADKGVWKTDILGKISTSQRPAREKVRDRKKIGKVRVRQWRKRGSKAREGERRGEKRLLRSERERKRRSVAGKTKLRIRRVPEGRAVWTQRYFSPHQITREMEVPGSSSYHQTSLTIILNDDLYHRMYSVIS